VYIFGFADYLGKRGPNYLLSKYRAETVKDYLLNLHGKNIFIADGKGQVNAATKNVSALGDPLNRRVDIIVTPSLKKHKPPTKAAAVPINKNDTVYKKINSLAKLNVGGSISLNELTFLPGRHFLNPEAVPILEALTAYLQVHENIKFQIVGHVCCIPGNQDGFDPDSRQNGLSLNRAKYIYNYLISKGIKAERMTCKGVGGSDPKISPELSLEDQAQNRRVVFVVLGK
jgi:outer membrane protein OmpA-like peptidoglycan-associated protein